MELEVIMVGVVMVEVVMVEVAVVKMILGEKASKTLLVSMMMVIIKMCKCLINCGGVLILKILMLMIMNVLMVR